MLSMIMKGCISEAIGVLRRLVSVGILSGLQFPPTKRGPDYTVQGNGAKQRPMARGPRSTAVNRQTMAAM